jgi:hypothetical protein
MTFILCFTPHPSHDHHAIVQYSARHLLVHVSTCRRRRQTERAILIAMMVSLAREVKIHIAV